MNLVERFIEVNSWSTARKSILLNAMGLSIILPGWLAMHLSSSVGFQNIDKSLLDTLVAAWLLAHVLCLVLSWIAIRTGSEGNWTAALFVFVQGPCLVSLIYMAGTWTSPFFALYPLATILLALWFGERTGRMAFIAGLISLTGLGYLEARGVLPHAPLLLNQEALLLPGRAIGRMLPVMAFFAYAFALCVLIVAARKLQDQRLRDAQKLIRRYVPSQVADAILSGRAETADRHERRKLTIFFSDLVGFTEISEELEPEDLSRVLNEYFSEMTRIADRHGGTVDELSGDAILVLFGAPLATSDKDHALRAVRMAIEMQHAMEGLNARWRAAGIVETLRVRMGINTGVVTVGNFGSPERMKYAALGRHVNLAARLQSQCEAGKVLLSHSTWLLVQDESPCTPKGELQLKGIHKPVLAYEIVAASAA